jgi:hypothetical protein
VVLEVLAFGCLAVLGFLGTGGGLAGRVPTLDVEISNGTGTVGSGTLEAWERVLGAMFRM